MEALYLDFYFLSVELSCQASAEIKWFILKERTILSIFTAYCFYLNNIWMLYKSEKKEKRCVSWGCLYWYLNKWFKVFIMLFLMLFLNLNYIVCPKSLCVRMSSGGVRVVAAVLVSGPTLHSLLQLVEQTDGAAGERLEADGDDGELYLAQWKAGRSFSK